MASRARAKRDAETVTNRRAQAKEAEGRVLAGPVKALEEAHEWATAARGIDLDLDTIGIDICEIDTMATRGREAIAQAERDAEPSTDKLKDLGAWP